MLYQFLVPETVLLSRGKMSFLYTTNINHFTKVSTYKLKHSNPQTGTTIVQLFCGCLRVGVSQSTIHIMEFQRFESRSYATVVVVDLMKKYPKIDAN